jgi:aldehyde:ferredoxin oxidoreductase
MLDEYYRARGWDLETGLPTPQKLAELGLGEEATAHCAPDRDRVAGGG